MEDSTTGSFCGKKSDEVRALVASENGAIIWDECVDLTAEQYGSFLPPVNAVHAPEIARLDASLTCSFCGVHLRDALQCVAGPTVYI